MSKRRMTDAERRFVDALLAPGCIICGADAELHHIPEARPNCLALGIPLCPEHHRGMAFPGQSIHSSRLIFCGKYGSELELMQAAILKVFQRSVPF